MMALRFVQFVMGLGKRVIKSENNILLNMKIKSIINFGTLISIILISISIIGCQNSNKSQKNDAKTKTEFLSNNDSNIPVPFLLKNGNKILVDSISFKPISNKQYQDLRLFHNGLAGAKLNGKWGFINLYEKIVIPFKYNLVSDFKNGIALVSLGFNKTGYINIQGDVVIPLSFSGFRSENMRMQLGYKYDSSTKKFSNYLINLIDFNVIQISDGKDPSEELIAVKKNGKWGFLDRNGVKKIQFKYDDAYPFSEGMARVKLNNIWIVIDKNGKELFQGATHYQDMDFHDGLLAVERDDKWGFIDKTGKVIVPFKFESVNNFKNGLAGVQLNSKWGLIDKKGEIFLPIIYNRIGDFSEGMISVCSDKLKWGFVDRNGRQVIEMKYDNVQNFIDGYTVVSELKKTSDGTEHKYGLINKTGQIVIPVKYNSMYVNQQIVVIKDGYENSEFYSKLNGKLFRELVNQEENSKKIKIMTFSSCNCGAHSCMLDFIDDEGKHHEFAMESINNYDFNCPSGDTYKNVRFEIFYETKVVEYEQFTETIENLISIKII